MSLMYGPKRHPFQVIWEKSQDFFIGEEGGEIKKYQKYEKTEFEFK